MREFLCEHHVELDSRGLGDVVARMVLRGTRDSADGRRVDNACTAPRRRASRSSQQREECSRHVVISTMEVISGGGSLLPECSSRNNIGAIDFLPILPRLGKHLLAQRNGAFLPFLDLDGAFVNPCVIHQ